MPAFLIYNSHSGSYNKLLIKTIIKKLKLLSEQVIAFDIYTDPAIDFNNCDLVCIAGGDGTISNVVNKIFKAKLENKIELIIVPLGSANILANSLKISKKFILKNWNYLRPSEIEVGEVNKRVFLSATSLGYLSKVINKTGFIYKNFLGFSAYIIKMLLNWNIPANNYQLIIDNKNVNEKAHSVVFSIGLNVIGFKSILKKPDQLIDVYLLKNKTPLGFISVLFDFIFNRSGNNISRYSAKEVVCDCNLEQELQIDGEKQNTTNKLSAKIVGRIKVRQ